MLRADLFAFAAFDAIGRLPAVGRRLAVFVHGILQLTAQIQTGQNVRNLDLLRAAFNAIPAGRARHLVLRTQNRADLLYCFLLLVVQRFEVNHVTYIVFHLRHAAHAGQHNRHVLEARRKTNRVACATSVVQAFKQRLRGLRQIDQTAAFHRLHDDDWLAMLAAHVIAFAAFDAFVFIIQIIELQLHEFHLRMIRENLVQNRRLVVERQPHMADLALRLQLQRRLIRVAFLVVIVVVAVLRMHQVEVEIIDAANLQLLVKHHADVLLRLEIAFRQLVGQEIFFTRITAGQTMLQRLLATAADIAVRRVEVVETTFDKQIRHAADLLQIDLPVLHGETHAAKAKLLFDFWKW